MHLLIPVDCASSCALSVLSLALVGLLLVCLWAYRSQHPGKLSIWGVLTLESLPDEARSIQGSIARKFAGQPGGNSDRKVCLEMVEAQRRIVYETQPPVSMAKMIMSRHTFRRPSPRPAPPPPRAPEHQLAPPPPRRARSLSPPRQPQPPPRQPPSAMV